MRRLSDLWHTWWPLLTITVGAGLLSMLYDWSVH